MDFTYVYFGLVAAFRGINKMMFSVQDKDNDVSISEDCANKYQAGWWYRYCLCENTNGKYLAGNNTHSGVGITYEAWGGLYHSMKYAQFMAIPHLYPLHFQ